VLIFKGTGFALIYINSHQALAVVGQKAIDNATPAIVTTAVNNNDIKADITDYISLQQYQADQGYQTLKGVLDSSISTESVIKKMEIHIPEQLKRVGEFDLL
jgi:hypothetical protein